LTDDRAHPHRRPSRIRRRKLPSYLDSPEAIADYLTAVLAEDDPALLAAALGDITRAAGMPETARRSGLTCAALYKALRPDSQPRFDTVARVCRALGIRLVAQCDPSRRGEAPRNEAALP
jgi:probable addiction module antidote protein